MTDDKTLKLIAKKLQSNNIEEVLFSIKQIRNIGEPKIIPVVIDLLANSKSNKVKDAAINLLNDLKNKDCRNEMIIALKNESYLNIHKELLSTCWQSGLDYTDEIELFVDLFINGNFGIAFEAFTIIETFEGNFGEPTISPLIDRLKNDISSFKGTDKEGLFVELIHILENLK